jgi:ketosteroid isomerase-like protein
MPTLSLAEQKRAAEKLGSDWFAAFLRHDVAALVQMSDLPFYIDNQIHVTQEDIRKRYEQMTDMADKSREGRPKLQLQRIQVQTIAE